MTKLVKALDDALAAGHDAIRSAVRKTHDVVRDRIDRVTWEDTGVRPLSLPPRNKSLDGSVDIACRCLRQGAGNIGIGIGIGSEGQLRDNMPPTSAKSRET